MHVDSVMPEEKFLMWLLTFSIVCKYSDARRKIPGEVTFNNACKFSDARRKIPSVITSF